MSKERGLQPHAIMVAFPFQGHITPYVNLAMKLASKGIVVTFVHLEFIHHTLAQSRADIFTEARRQSGLDIRYTTISDGFPLEFERDDDYWEFMFVNFEDRVDELVGNIIHSHPQFATFLVTDTLFTWQAAIASNHNLLHVSFWTEPALIFSLSYNVELLQEHGHFLCKDDADEEINYVPGVESISTKDLMSYFKEGGRGSIVLKTELKAFEEVKKADFILHNTVGELESETISALNKHQPNYAIGPISFSKNLATNTVNKSLRSESDCSGWLNSKPPGSVLYISFGSTVSTSKEVVEEIAYGLLISEVNFIWAVREDSVTPALDGVKEKGLIVPWCDQIKVLSNAAVGGFVTHCGWNSILESIWCGVPMICHPVEYDQPTNRKLVVDDWRVGVNLCDGRSVDRKEVAMKFKNLISSDVLKKEVQKKSAELHNVLERDGSSERNFNQFVEDLRAKLVATA